MTFPTQRVLTLALLISLSLGLAGPSWAKAAQGAAPDFTLKSQSGKNLRLSEYRGEVVLINFWASWCGPCREEMPLLEELQQRYHKVGFTVLGINVEENANEALKLLSKHPVSFPVLFDPESEVSRLYQVEAMPSTVLVDRDGNMRYLHRGFKAGYADYYREQIRELIRE